MKKRMICLLGLLISVYLWSQVFGLGLGFRIANAQYSTGVQIIDTTTSTVFERYYSGSGPIDIVIPAETVRDRQRETQLIYGILAFPNNDGSSEFFAYIIPDKGSEYSYHFFKGDVNTDGLFLGNTATPTIFPNMSYRIVYANSGNIDWRLVLYTRAYCN